MQSFRMHLLICLILAARQGSVCAEEAARASQWVQALRSDAGICWVPRCRDGRLAVAIAQSSRLLVLAEDSDWDHVAATRACVRAAGLPDNRVLVDRSDLVGRAPFPDNYVDLIVVDDLRDQTLSELPARELQRVLAPHGLLVVGSENARAGGMLTRAALSAWLKASDIADARVMETNGLWIACGKPMPSGVDDWSQWFHGPDNNPISNDRVLKWPYATQWLALPFQSPQPDLTLVSDGRVFLFLGHGWGGSGLGGARREQTLTNTLLVRSAHNGQELWRRQLPDNFLVHRSCAVATPQSFYLLDGAGVLDLDPATGRERGRITCPGMTGETKWLSLSGQTLLMLAGAADPSFETIKDNNRYGTIGSFTNEIAWGFGCQIAAFDVMVRRMTWQHGEKKPVDSRLVGVRDGRVFAYVPNSRAVCLDVASGRELWSNDRPDFLALMEAPEAAEPIVNRTSVGALCTPDAVVFHRVGFKNLVALSPADGHVLWCQAPGKNAKKWGQVHIMAADGKLYTSVGVFDPVTGTPGPKSRFDTICSRITGSPDAFYGQSGRCFDRRTSSTTQSQGLKVSCYDACVPADGMLFGAPQSCVCEVSLRGQIAFAPVSETSPAAGTETESGRLELFPQADRVVPLQRADNDWPMYRADTQRSGSSRSAVAASAQVVWTTPNRAVATSPVTVGDLVFVGRADGLVQALDANNGKVCWEYATGGRILASPTIWSDRLYVGSGDGRVYCLEAATGRPLWRFLAAPQRRRIMVYGALAETWPVDSGVLVTPQETTTHQPGRELACFAAGITSLDGAHVWAVDARTGQMVWHQGGWQLGGDLEEKTAAAQRIGICAAGGLTADRGHLWMAGGGWVGQVCFDLGDGKMAPPDFSGGPCNRNPAAEIGLFAGRFVYLGGSVLYRGAGERRWSKGHGMRVLPLDEQAHALYPEIRISDSYITPCWDLDNLVLTGGEGGGSSVICMNAKNLLARLDQVPRKPLPAKAWQRPLTVTLSGCPSAGLWDQRRQTYGLILASNAVVVLCDTSVNGRTKIPEPRSWSMSSLDRAKGNGVWDVKLPSEPILNGLCLDHRGRAIVSLTDGGVACVGKTTGE